MFSIEEFIIAVYCCVDEGLQVLTQGHSPEELGKQSGNISVVIGCELRTRDILSTPKRKNPLTHY